MRRAKYKLREPTLFKAFLWLLPLSLAIYIVVMGIVEDAVVEGVGLAVFFAAIFCALNMLYFSMTHRVIFKDHVCDVRFHPHRPFHSLRRRYQRGNDPGWRNLSEVPR